jgi:hypothetical protein
MARSDVFVLLDDVQYKKNEWQNRNKIRNARGWQWITIPVKYRFGEKINQVKIDNTGHWRKEHYNSLIINYGKAPYFREYEPFFKDAYERTWEYLVDINIYFIEFIVRALGLQSKLIRSSRLGVRENRSERLAAICKKVGARTYLSGEGAREYLDLSVFAENNIEVIFQNYCPPVYRQAYQGFEPFMSVVDLLFNYGSKSLALLKGESI